MINITSWFYFSFGITRHFGAISLFYKSLLITYCIYSINRSQDGCLFEGGH